MMNPVTRDNTNKILISSARGSLSCLRRELIDLGYPVVEETPAGIETEGTLDDTMELNLYLRTGQRVLYMLQQISVKTVDDFYKKIRELNWEQYIPSDGYLCVTSSVDSPLISDSRFAHQKCKDAIVDRIKDKRGRRPDSGPKKDGTVVFLYWKKDTVGIYLDTSGEPLSKRGYRTEPLRAPMQGTLAASVVMATGWNGNSTFINPMCGSGTLAIEAALMAMRKPPGLTRDNFGFMHLAGFNKERWSELRKRAEKNIRDILEFKCIVTDKSKKAIEAAKTNARKAGVFHLMDFRVCDFRETPISVKKGVIIFNPEYGERLGNEEALAETYAQIGDFLKNKCKGYLGYIFTGNVGLAKKVGLRTKRRLTFYSGGIECRLLEYELYEGSRKG